MGYERLRVVKPLKQLIKTVELYTRHVAKENRGQWRDAKMVVYGCFGNLIRAAEEWETKEKGKYLTLFLDGFAVFRGMMQVFEETKIVSNKKASEIALHTADIKKQVSLCDKGGGGCIIPALLLSLWRFDILIGIKDYTRPGFVAKRAPVFAYPRKGRFWAI